MGRGLTRAEAAPKKVVAPPKAAPKAAKPKAAPAHPPWQEMIQECIKENKDDARRGVSRPQIKKYVEDVYQIEMDNSRVGQLSRAITSGVEKGVFVLPKGPSGRVKLAPKNKPAVESDEEAPKPKAKAEKVQTTAKTKAAEAKPTATTKKTLAGKPKATTTTKKTTATSKRGSAKAAITGATPAVKAKAAEKRAAPKKAPESTTKKSTTTRTTSKAAPKPSSSRRKAT